MIPFINFQYKKIRPLNNTDQANTISSRDTETLQAFVLHLADDALILGHRNSEWTGHGPILEQDIALSNISLDLIGQARNFYEYAAKLKRDGSTEDSLAYLRGPNEFKNCLLVEQENGDWGKTVLRQFLFSVYQRSMYVQLEKCSDKDIAAIAEKALKEVRYHLRWSSEWVIRLGDGTEESHMRMEKAITNLWAYTNELLVPADYEIDLQHVGINLDYNVLKKEWTDTVTKVLHEATLSIPEQTSDLIGGKQGNHTELLVTLLTEMQFMQRTYPGCEW